MLKNTEVEVKPLEKSWNKMYFGFVDTTYGQMALAAFLEDDNMYVAYFQFSGGQSIGYFANDIREHWPDMECVENKKMVRAAFLKYFLEKEPPKVVYIVLNGTEFDNAVWLTLSKVPYGWNRTYSELAFMARCPKAVRAVANAVAKNNIALFVPCHRVRAKHNDKLKYRWGSDLKKKLLLDENDGNLPHYLL